MAFDGYSRNTAPSAPALTTGQGAEILDANGKRLIDCCSQTLNNNLGQCHPSVVEAVVHQVSRLTYASSRFSSDVSERLHRKLLDITPDNLMKVNLASVTGSLANECAVKAARKRKGVDVIVSRDRAHLGQSMEMMRISGKHYESPLINNRNARFLPAPYCYRCPFQKKPSSCSAECLDGFEDLLRHEGGSVAAVVIEPIMVDAGVLAPPMNYHHRIETLAKEHDVALIWDEIQTGFGWLGAMFAMDIYDVQPDILTLGKGLGAGFPIAATLFAEDYDVLQYGEHEFTSGANPVSCAASLAMIDHLLATEELRRVREKGDLVRSRLLKLRCEAPVIGDVRGIGLIMGVEIVEPTNNEPDSELTVAVFRDLLQQGVITRVSRVGAHSNVIQFKPPVVITEEQLDEALSKFEAVVRAV